MIKWDFMLCLQIGCFLAKLGVEHGKRKWKYSKGIFKIVKELEIAKYQITLAERLLDFDILDDFQ